MFYDFPQDFRERELAPGHLARLVWGERIMLSHVSIQPHSTMPRHSHPYEELGMILEGELEWTIGGETRKVGKRQGFLIPPNVEHSAVTGGQPTVVLEAFSPPREDYK